MFRATVTAVSFSLFNQLLPVVCVCVCVCDCKVIDPDSVIHRLCLPLPKGKMFCVTYAKSIITEWNHLSKWKRVTTTYTNGYVQVRVESLMIVHVWFACHALNTSSVIRVKKFTPSLEGKVHETCHRELRGQCIQTYFACQCHWIRAVVAREGTGIHNSWLWPNHCPMWGTL